MTIAVLDATGQTQQILSATELSTALAAIVTAVTGTVTPTQPVSAVALPLPSGAATGAGQSSMVSAQAATTAAVALTTAAQNFAAVAPSDTSAVPNFATIKSLYVTVAGNLVVKGVNGTTVTLPVVVGQIVPFAPSFVMAATTATVVALL